MKKLRLFFVATVVLLMTFSFAACGTDEGNTEKTKVAKPTLSVSTFIYDGTAHTVTVTESAAYTMSGDITKTEVGNYTATVTLVDTAKYEWTDGTTEAISLNWSITAPEIELNFTAVYNMAVELGYNGTLEELIEAFKGDSAYQIAVNNGYEGSESEWLETLIGAAGTKGDKGDKGETGATGATGENGITPHISTNGNWYIGTTDTGVKAKGEDGSNGESAFDIWKELYGDNNSTEEDFFEWLKAEPAKDGKSAYELFVQYNPDYTASEADWVNDLANGRLARMTITFKTDGDDIIREVFYNHVILDVPAPPQKVGYIGYWDFDFEDVITAPTTISHDFKIINYDITYNLDGGINGTNPALYNIETEVIFEPATKTDYGFEGWFLDSNFTQRIDNIEIGNIGNMVLYAKFYKLNGQGTQSDPFNIYSKETLVQFATQVNQGEKFIGKYFELRANIDLEGMEWTPIGTHELLYFDGTFNGQNYIISNFQVTTSQSYAGLFGNLKGTIKNLGVTDYDITDYSATSAFHAGGLVGYVTGATIIDCYAIGNVTAISSGYPCYAGGLIGYAHGSYTTVTGCYAIGNITASDSAGGLIGYSYGTYTKIDNCYAISNVTASSPSIIANAGGLVGYISGGITTISNCFTEGNVTAIATSNAYAGGLIGYIFYTSIKNCLATTDVTASTSSNTAYAGGLIGYITNYTSLDNCLATGNISATTNSEYVFASGVINKESGTITNCYRYEGQVFYREQSTGTFDTANEFSGEICTLEMLNNINFYTTSLGWDNDVWDFSDLDFENGKLPTLKGFN